MKYIEAPDIAYGSQPSIFLAGGISGCSNWQNELVEMLKDTPLTIYNPRRENFPMGDLEEGKKQIEWEYQHLRKSWFVSFWFPCETLNPITLFELGTVCSGDKIVFVGCHPDYKRRFDVEQQLKLRRPEVEVVYSIDSLAKQILRKQYGW